MTKPDFIDNRKENTLAQALGKALGINNSGKSGDYNTLPDEIRIATAYFSPTGFAQIADLLEPIPTVRLLLGADLAAGMPNEKRRLDETEAMFEQRQMQTRMNRLNNALRQECDSLPFTNSSRATLRKLIAALRAGNMEVRKFEKTFLHAKAYIFSPKDDGPDRPKGIIAGSSNLTLAGLTSNLELNLGRYDQPIVEKAKQWFDDLWNDAEPYDLAIVFEDSLKTRTPWEIFLRVLWQLYGDEIDEETRENDDLPLTSFQKHGVARSLRLIKDTGGAIVADEVGLGKTFIAGDVLQIYRERRQRVLLICPASLRDTTWKKFLTRFQLFVECLSYGDLANDKQLQDAQRPHADQEKLQRPLDEYQLIIVDEAHNYRNPEAPTRAAALRRLLFGRRRDVLFLTATPVNNSLWDLYHLILFFVRQDAHFAARGILSIRERFELAMREDPSNLSPDILYPIIDATTVKRTRQFVRKHYGGDYITGSDGNLIPIIFPKPMAISVRYNLNDLLPGLFDQLEKALDPDSAVAISFARYMPDAYRLTEVEIEEDARSRALVGLLRSSLLKRFESSASAFYTTVKKMAQEHKAFLEALDAGYVVTTDFMKELSADDEEIFEEILAGTEHKEDAKLFDVSQLRTQVEHDRGLLLALASKSKQITLDLDPKLQALSDELVLIAKQATVEATDGNDEAQKRKVLIFSYFEDTVVWIRDFLQKELNRRPELAGYRNRMVVVSGSGDLDEVSRLRAVQGFAPISMEAPTDADSDLYDLLISTDVLAEGVNLQQCRHIINFDMPWNPMRLVQRHGRIDRIGSKHSHVFMRTIFPVDRLDRLLNLEQRILNKLAMAAASIGVVAPIEHAEHGTQVFTETRDEIEKLLNEDASLFERGSTASAAQSGEEYRQTLRNALAQDRGGISKLPRKIGSGMVKGNKSGVFFCAVVGKRTYLRFVSANKDWRVSNATDAILSEVGTCLRLIECEPDTITWCPDVLQDRVYDFWQAAQQDIWSDWMRETDPVNIHPRVRPLNLRVAEFIRANTPASITKERTNRALDILESPWPYREEIILRKWFNEDGLDGIELAHSLVEKILDSGLEPVEHPPLLPPIDHADIELLCWMGIDSTSEEKAGK